MESSELVQQLLTGSKRINQMKQEIDTIIKMILGLLKKTELPYTWNNEIICGFESAGLHWTITKNKRPPHRKATSFCVTVISKPKSSQSDSIVLTHAYPTEKEAILVKFQYVQRVYQGLPDFLTNMKKVFPELKNLFTPLLEAAAAE